MTRNDVVHALAFVSLFALLWLALASAGARPCAWTTMNHSGVEECHVGPYDGPTPTDTTQGRDIRL